VTYEKADKRANSIARWARWGVLALVLAVSTAIGILHQQRVVPRPVGVDALCPFGALESVLILVTDSVFLRRIALSSFILFAIVLVIAVVFRRSFCGLICPLGALQEGFSNLGRTLLGKNLTMPAAIDKPARYLKYVVLVVFVYLAWTTATLAIRPYDPWVAYHHILSDELLSEFLIGTIVLAVSLAGSFFYNRFFCKYLCPMGAFLALISRLSLFKIHRSDETCIDCMRCDKVCPTNVAVATAGTVEDVECINCNECVTVCPAKGALEVSTVSGKTLTPLTVLGLVSALIVFVLAATTATGSFAWTTGGGHGGGQGQGQGHGEGEGSGQGGKGGGKGEGGQGGGQGQGSGQGSGGSVEVPSDDGTFSVATITGQVSFTDVTEGAGVPATAFEQVFGVPTDAQALPMGRTKDAYGFTPGEVRCFVELYLQEPAVALEYVPGTYEH
jgi:polyferredoxin